MSELVDIEAFVAAAGPSPADIIRADLDADDKLALLQGTADVAVAVVTDEGLDGPADDNDLPLMHMTLQQAMDLHRILGVAIKNALKAGK
jgi:hypothetical protein